MDGTYKAKIEGTETDGGGKDGSIAFDESEDLEAPSNNNIQVVFEREDGW